VREEYLLLRPGEAGPTRVSIAIPARATGFLGDATVVGRGSESPAASRLSLTIAVDGETVLPLEPPPHPAAKSFSVPLEGKRELELVVSGANPPANGAWIHVAGAHFAWKP
jgi:hypothetical protein